MKRCHIELSKRLKMGNHCFVLEIIDFYLSSFLYFLVKNSTIFRKSKLDSRGYTLEDMYQVHVCSDIEVVRFREAPA